MTSSSAEEIIKRLGQAYDAYEDATLALKLGRDEGTLRVWRSRDMVPLSVLVEASRATDYSLDWLRSGGAEHIKPAQKTPADDRNAVVLSAREHELLNRYRHLTDLLKDHVDNTCLLASLAYHDRKAYHDAISKPAASSQAPTNEASIKQKRTIKRKTPGP